MSSSLLCLIILIMQKEDNMEQKLKYLLSEGESYDVKGENEKALEFYLSGLELSKQFKHKEYIKQFSQLILTLL